MFSRRREENGVFGVEEKGRLLQEEARKLLVLGVLCKTLVLRKNWLMAGGSRGHLFVTVHPCGFYHS